MRPIAIHPDPANPRGGHAVLGLPRQGAGPVHVTILDRFSQYYLGPSGWQAGAAQLGPLGWSDAGGGYVAGPGIVSHLEVSAQLLIQLAGQEFLAIWPATIRPPTTASDGVGGVWVPDAPKPDAPKPDMPPPAPPVITGGGDEGKGTTPPDPEKTKGMGAAEEQTKEPQQPGRRRQLALIAAATLAAVVAAQWFFGKPPPPEFMQVDAAIAAALPTEPTPPQPGADTPIDQPRPPELAALPQPDAMPPTDDAPAQAPSDAFALMLGLQTQLQAHGCAPGVPDGEYGEKSVRAAEVFNRLAPESCGALQPLGSMRDGAPDADWIRRGQHNWQVLQSCVPQTACGGPAPVGLARETSRGCLYDPSVHDVYNPAKRIDGGGTAEWTGACVDGFVSGKGTLNFAYQTSGVPQDYRQSWTGAFLKGRPDAGMHVVTELNGRIWRRPLDGQGVLNGKGSIEHADGKIERGLYTNNRRVGVWEVTGGTGSLRASLFWDGALAGNDHAVDFPSGPTKNVYYRGGITYRANADGTLDVLANGVGVAETYLNNVPQGRRNVQCLAGQCKTIN